MKQKINEAFEWTVKQKQKQDGSGTYFIAYIDPNLSQGENTYAVKDTLKDKFGMKFDKFGKYWFMYLSSDPVARQNQIDKILKPAVEFLKTNEQTHNNKDVDGECAAIIAQIDALINAIDNGDAIIAGTEAEFDEKEMKVQLQNYKNELIAAFQNGTFKEKMGPIIKFRQAQGTKYSLVNCILIMMQKKDARMVKSTTKWKIANKSIKPGAKAIALWVPYGTKEKTPEQKNAAKNKFLQKMSKKYGRPISEKDLNVGEREKLMDELNKTEPVGFKLRPNFYDISDTIQMDGKEDIVGNLEGIDNVEWFDNASPVDEKSTRLYDAVLAAVQEKGIEITYGNEESLQGARGLSKGGEIEVLENVPKNAGTVSTLVHEFAHELLHQSYLKGKNEDLSVYFVGRPEGRELVEQQAEMTAWIVMRNFGYDMQEAVNYMGCWGANENSAAYVFDTIANTASLIINLINEQMAFTVAESRNPINEAMTGLDVAAMFGSDAVEIYKKAKRASIGESFMRMMKRINEADIS